MAVCCPPGAVGAPSFQSGPTKGEMVTLVSPDENSKRPSLPCYQIGPAKPKYVFVVFSDVFGIEAGNQKAFCDTLQSTMGNETAVWMPDMFRGSPIVTDWYGSDALSLSLSLLPTLYKVFFKVKVSEMEQDLLEIVEPHLKATECELVGCIGFCWGGWVVARCLGLNHGRSVFAAGIGVHPAWKPEIFVSGGGTEKDLGERTKNKPILFLPAKQDGDFKVDSPLVQRLAKRRAKLPNELSVAFEDMDHGFVARGNPKVPQIKEAQGKALEIIRDFFVKTFKIA